MEQQGPHLIIPIQLAQRVVDYIRNSPSPMAPVKEAMDIIQKISNLPRAEAEEEKSPAPKKPAPKKPAPKKPAAKPTKKS